MDKYDLLLLFAIISLIFLVYVLVVNYKVMDETCNDFGGEFDGMTRCVKNGVIYELVNVKPLGSLFGEYIVARYAYETDVNSEENEI